MENKEISETSKNFLLNGIPKFNNLNLNNINYPYKNIENMDKKHDFTAIKGINHVKNYLLEEAKNNMNVKKIDEKRNSINFLQKKIIEKFEKTEDKNSKFISNKRIDYVNNVFFKNNNNFNSNQDYDISISQKLISLEKNNKTFFNFFNQNNTNNINIQKNYPNSASSRELSSHENKIKTMYNNNINNINNYKNSMLEKKISDKNLQKFFNIIENNSFDLIKYTPSIGNLTNIISKNKIIIKNNPNESLEEDSPNYIKNKIEKEKNENENKTPENLKILQNFQFPEIKGKKFYLFEYL